MTDEILIDALEETVEIVSEKEVISEEIEVVLTDEQIEELALIEAQEEEARLQEAARLKEVGRQEALQARIDALKDCSHAFHTLYPEIPNCALFMKELLSKAPTSAGKIMKALELKDDEIYALHKSKEYIENRKKEYPSMDAVLHVILDHGISSQGFIELQQERAVIKAKYPKDV